MILAKYWGFVKFDCCKGQPIGNNDLWIAAHTLAMELVVVTTNQKEFSRVPKLKVENWVE